MEKTMTNGKSADASILFLYSETPVHAGSGDVQAAIDLPIQRSVQTRWPILNDGSLRGGLRDMAMDWAKSVAGEQKEREDRVCKWFGSMPGESDLQAGRISTPDAEVLLFPVASARGLTAWVTCPAAIAYFRRKLAMFRSRTSEAAGKAVDELGEIVRAGIAVEDGKARITTGSAVAWNNGAKLILESDAFDVVAPAADKLAAWFAKYALPFDAYWQDRLQKHFAVISDETFRMYVLHKTDVRTRVQLSNNVVKHGPWTEENLPVDTMLYTVLAATSADADLDGIADVLGFASKPVVQLGGDQNLGRGVMRLRRLGD